MMYSRLKLARNLLNDDGVLFISIDDNEVNNLKIICDEIFGSNSSKTIAVKMSEPSGLKMGAVLKNGIIPKLKEYVLIVKKSGAVNGIFFDKIKKEIWDNEYNLYLDNFTIEDRQKIDEITNSEEIKEEDILFIDKILERVKLTSVSEKLKELNITADDRKKWLFSDPRQCCGQPIPLNS